MNIQQSNCLIISGGNYSPVKNINNYNYIIACDKGYEYSHRLGINPDLIMGDYDSYDGDITSDVISNCKEDDKIPQIMTFPKEKDDTDTMLAVKYALDNGIKHITICCALGGRMDHTYSNIATMLYVATHQGICEIISDTEHMIMFDSMIFNEGKYALYDNCKLENHTLLLPRKENHTLSLFAMTSQCEGLNIRGAKYEVSDVTLYSDTSLGASNEWKEKAVNIDFQKGILLVIMSKM